MQNLMTSFGVIWPIGQVHKDETELKAIILNFYHFTSHSNHIRKINLSLVSFGSPCSSQSLWSVRQQPKAHQNREGTRGKNQLLAHILAPLKHVKNVVRLETSARNRRTALMRHNFYDWADQSDAQIPTLGVTLWLWQNKAELSHSQ